MEPQTTFTSPVTPLSQTPTQPNNKCRIWLIILGILTLAGLGFGGFELYQNLQKDQKIAQLSTKSEQKTPEQSQATQDNDSQTAGSEVTNPTSGPYVKDHYFFVPNWNLKFKIPTELVNYGYSVNYDEAQIGSTLPTIGFTAMLKSDVKPAAQARYYDDIGTCAIVSVSKEKVDWDKPNKQINGIIKKFDNYSLLIWDYSRHNSCDHKLHIDEVQAKLQAMFSNPESI